MEPDWFPQTLRLVRSWNDAELLGIDLADTLESVVRGQLTKLFSEDQVHHMLLDVNWCDLAENYALVICNVDEDELTRRLRVAEAIWQ